MKNKYRIKEAKKEAVKNALCWLIANELIKYQVRYFKPITEKEKDWYGRKCYYGLKELYCVRVADRNIFYDEDIYNIIEPLMMSQAEDTTDWTNGVSLNPTRKTYRFYVYQQDLKDKIPEIEEITKNNTPNFSGKVWHLAKDATPKEVIEKLEKQQTYVNFETDEDDNISWHYQFGRSC